MRAIGTTAVVAVTEPATADRAEQILRDELVAIDRTCSRFRPDSELSALHGAHGAPLRVSSLLFEAIEVAYDVARRTQGAVDPTVGVAVEALGYDRDFDELGTDDGASDAPRPAPGWSCIELDRRRRTVRVPAGVHIDLGASAKALVADRAALRIAEALRCGVLVSIGGDVAVAGSPPVEGWAVGIARDSSSPLDAVDQVVALRSGGIASSSTAVRTWRHQGRRVHHIVDPATGDSASTHWTLVSCSADSCVDANAASTAAIVWGAWAVPNLVALERPARLVRHDGEVLTLNGWPADTSGHRQVAS
jgi:thiamine biosynthesis lipoprotein